ncbi:hypothetical protein YC2023_109868 [Brassica napus]
MSLLGDKAAEIACRVILSAKNGARRRVTVLRTCVDIGAILVEPGHKLKIRTESLDFMCVLNGCLELMQAENVEKLISAKSSSPADAALEGIHASFCPPFKG